MPCGMCQTLLMSLSVAKTVVSSAKWTKCIWFDDLYMSLIYKRKSTGPNMETCETPNVLFDLEELQFWIEMYCFLLVEYDSNQCCMTPLTLSCRSLFINMLWLAVSNGFEKSRYTAMVLCLLSNDEQTLSRNSIIATEILDFLWKPIWFVHKILFYFR